MRLTSSAEGVTPTGTTVTTGNSGGASGNAFDVVTLPAGGSIVSDSDAAHGALSYLITIGATLDKAMWKRRAEVVAWMVFTAMHVYAAVTRDAYVWLYVATASFAAWNVIGRLQNERSLKCFFGFHD